MGANAQTTVPTFTAGQVLTADQQNQSARTGIPVFATTITRDAGFGGTGEKTLAEGQLCYVEGTGLQSYNGSAWVTWGAAPTSGLTFISSTTVGSAVSSVTISNVFSNTYDNYRIVWRNITTSATQNFQMTLSGTSGSTYNYFQLNYTTGSSTPAVTTGTTTLFIIGAQHAGELISGSMDVIGPNLAAETKIVGQASTATKQTPGFTGTDTNAAASTGFTFQPGSGTMTGGVIKVYGYQNS